MLLYVLYILYSIMILLSVLRSHSTLLPRGDYYSSSTRLFSATGIIFIHPINLLIFTQLYSIIIIDVLFVLNMC